METRKTNLGEGSICGADWAVVRPKARVLILDDEEPVTKLIRLLLTLEGYSVLVAESEPEAIEVALGAQGKLDWLLADVRLKVGSGPTTARRLAARYPALKTVFMSGYSRTDLIGLGLLEEKDAFLPKPFELPAFRTLMREGFVKEAQWSPAR